MLTAEGPVLLECNARFGDPETQAILPRLAGALGPLLLAAARGSLPADLAIVPTLPGAAVAIVLAAGGYPDAPARGAAIHGLEDARSAGSTVFHAGTTRDADGTWRTSGGRVLAAVGHGADLAAARAIAEAGADRIAFDGLQRRKDIGVESLRADRPAVQQPVGATS